jgi:hypothetical protein
MYNFLQTFHSHFRWIIFLAAIIAIVLPIINANQTVNKKSKLPALVFMIVTDVQFLMGILLYFVYSSIGLSAFEKGMAFVMKNTDLRKIAVEHFTLMIIAWAMVHIGYLKIKKAQTGKQVQKTSLLFFGIALVLILAAIPWARL